MDIVLFFYILYSKKPLVYSLFRPVRQLLNFSRYKLNLVQKPQTKPTTPEHNRRKEVDGCFPVNTRRYLGLDPPNERETRKPRRKIKSKSSILKRNKQAQSVAP